MGRVFRDKFSLFSWPLPPPVTCLLPRRCLKWPLAPIRRRFSLYLKRYPHKSFRYRCKVLFRHKLNFERRGKVDISGRCPTVSHNRGFQAPIPIIFEPHKVTLTQRAAVFDEAGLGVLSTILAALSNDFPLMLMRNAISVFVLGPHRC